LTRDDALTYRRGDDDHDYGMGLRRRRMMRSLGICIGATTLSLVGMQWRDRDGWRREISRVEPITETHGKPLPIW